jgi:hypothetical protein
MEQPQEVSEGMGGTSDLTGGLAIALAALKRIAEGEDAPDIDATGEWRFGLHCGVEDRDCQDRYDGADYGHTVGVEKGLEWASNEAKHALEQMANNIDEPRPTNKT